MGLNQLLTNSLTYGPSSSSIMSHPRVSNPPPQPASRKTLQFNSSTYQHANAGSILKQAQGTMLKGSFSISHNVTPGTGYKHSTNSIKPVSSMDFIHKKD